MTGKRVPPTTAAERCDELLNELPERSEYLEALRDSRAVARVRLLHLLQGIDRTERMCERELPRERLHLADRALGRTGRGLPGDGLRESAIEAVNAKSPEDGGGARFLLLAGCQH